MLVHYVEDKAEIPEMEQELDAKAVGVQPSSESSLKADQLLAIMGISMDTLAKIK
jgi:hypothetical protein